MISDKFIDLITDGRIKLNGCQVNLGGENSMNCYMGEKEQKEERISEPDDPNGILDSDDARKELAKYQEAGILDDNFQPIRLTRAQMGCIALVVGDALGLSSQWKDFGRLWHIDSELLRSQFNKGKDTEPTRQFYKRIYAL